MRFTLLRKYATTKKHKFTTPFEKLKRNKRLKLLEDDDGVGLAKIPKHELENGEGLKFSRHFKLGIITLAIYRDSRKQRLC